MEARGFEIQGMDGNRGFWRGRGDWYLANGKWLQFHSSNPIVAFIKKTPVVMVRPAKSLEKRRSVRYGKAEITSTSWRKKAPVMKKKTGADRGG